MRKFLATLRHDNTNFFSIFLEIYILSLNDERLDFSKTLLSDLLGF